MNNRDIHIRRFCAVKQADGSWLHEYGETTWYNELGQLHREDGPSVICAYELRWYLYGVNYVFDEWLIKLNKSDEEKMLLRLQYA